MITFKEKSSASDKDVRVRDQFAFLPLVIERPSKGYLWLEFYGVVEEYYNGAWHFVGKLHRDFEKGAFENNTGKVINVHWDKPNLKQKTLFFIRAIMICLVWMTLLIGVVLFIHKYI